MRRCWVGGIVSGLCALGVALGAAPAGAQEMALARRGPRFLFAATPEATPRPIDLRSAPVLRRQIALDLDGATVADALAAITRQTRLSFVYSRDLVSTEHRVHLRADPITVAAALTEILLDADVDVMLSSSYKAALVRRTEVEAAIVPQGSIAGWVADAKTGVALVGATVAVEGASRSATTGTDGRYRIGNVTPGTYAVQARSIGYSPAKQSVSVVEGQEALADFALAKSVQRLDEVVTTGTLIPTEVKALPTPITVITAEDIELQHPRRFDELLRLAVPGAVVFEPDPTQGATAGGPGVVYVSVRGTSSLSGTSNPKFYIDGIETALRNVVAIDPQSIERMEVLRGPQAAAIYGSDAIAGVVQIFTKRGTALRQQPEVELGAALGRIESTFSESGALRQDYTAALSGKTGSANYRIGGGYRRTGEWMPSYYDRTPSLNGAVRVEQETFSVDLSARIEDATTRNGFDTRLAPITFTSPSYTEGSVRSESYGMRVAYRPVSWWRHSATVGIDRAPQEYSQYQRGNRTPDDTLLGFANNAFQRVSAGYYTTLETALRPGLGATVTAGTDHYVNKYSGFEGSAVTITPLVLPPGASPFVVRQRTTNSGLFAQAQINVRDALFLTGSVRAEDNSDFGTDLKWPRSTRAGLTYVRNVGGVTVKLRTSYGQAIRPPSFGSKDSVSFGCCYYQRSNPDLRPERQSGPDGGVDLVFGRTGSFSVTHYDQTVKDLISYAQSSTATVFITQWVNIARVKNVGWEFEGTVDLGRVVARANFAITHSRPEDLGPGGESPFIHLGQQMQGIPEHTAGLTLTATPLSRTTVTAGVAYQGSRFGLDWLAFYKCEDGLAPCLDPSNPFDLTPYNVLNPSVTKVNLSVDRDLSRGLAAYVNVEDLTNESAKRAINDLTTITGRITTVGFRLRH